MMAVRPDSKSGRRGFESHSACLKSNAREAAVSGVLVSDLYWLCSSPWKGDGSERVLVQFQLSPPSSIFGCCLPAWRINDREVVKGQGDTWPPTKVGTPCTSSCSAVVSRPPSRKDPVPMPNGEAGDT